MLFSKIPNSKHDVLGVKVEHGKSFAAGQCIASCAWKYQSRYAYVTTKDKKAVCECLETTHKEKIDHSDDTFKCDGERHGHFAAVHNAITNDQIKTHGVSESGNLLEQPRSEYQRVLHLALRLRGRRVALCLRLRPRLGAPPFLADGLDQRPLHLGVALLASDFEWREPDVIGELRIGVVAKEKHHHIQMAQACR